MSPADPKKSPGYAFRSFRESAGWVFAALLAITMIFVIVSRPTSTRTEKEEASVLRASVDQKDEDDYRLVPVPDWLVADCLGQEVCKLKSDPAWRPVLSATLDLAKEYEAMLPSNEKALVDNEFAYEVMVRGLAWGAEPQDRVVVLERVGEYRKAMVIRGENAGLPGWIHQKWLQPAGRTIEDDAKRISVHLTFAGWADAVGSRLNGKELYKYELESISGSRPMVPVQDRAWILHAKGDQVFVVVLEGQYRGLRGFVDKRFAEPRTPLGVAGF